MSEAEFAAVLVNDMARVRSSTAHDNTFFSIAPRQERCSFAFTFRAELATNNHRYAHNKSHRFVRFAPIGGPVPLLSCKAFTCASSLSIATLLSDKVALSFV